VAVKTRPRKARRASAHSPRSAKAPSSPVAVRLRSALDGLAERLLNPIDIASLVFFRIFFGIICFWHVWLQMPLVEAEYIIPDFHFKYYFFGWVEPLPGQLMHAVFLTMAASTIFIALGLFYRAAAVTFFVLHTYILLIDVANYWNHYYLISLLAFLMIFVPAHRAYSLDVARGAVDHSDDAPAWGLWILRAQMGIVYFYAGLAKLTSSDWLHGKPMDIYLADESNLPFIGSFVSEPWVVDVASYSGMLFDLFILPLLLWQRTRIPALCIAIGFHLTNSLIFDIQVFPWLAIVTTLLFLPSSWPRLAGQWVRVAPSSAGSTSRHRPDRLPPRRPLSSGQLIAGILAFYFAVQVLLPLRVYAYPGNPLWTSEGHFFSWRMLLADRGGSMAFFLRNKSTDELCHLNITSYIHRFQVGWLRSPDVMVQFAQHVAGKYKDRGINVAVHAWSEVSVNGRANRALVEPDVDLASVSRTLGHHAWLTDVETAPTVDRPTAPACPDPPPLGSRIVPQAPDSAGDQLD
jgi:uncharacterized membrane protein YphA (DoxX/SURF4 family)